MGLVLTQQCLADGRRDIKEKGWICLHNPSLWHPSSMHAHVCFSHVFVVLLCFSRELVGRGGVHTWCGGREQLHLPCMSTTGSGADTQEERWLSHPRPRSGCLLSKDNNDHAALQRCGAFRLCRLGAWSVWPRDYLPTEPLYIQAYWTSSCPLVFRASKVSRMLSDGLFYT